MKTNSFKRILSFGMAAIMFLAVTACGKNSGSSDLESSNSNSSSLEKQNGADALSQCILEKTVKSILQS